MEWWVYIYDFNRNCIRHYNIFEHRLFKQECDKAWLDYNNDFNKFSDVIKKSLRYYFWSKCEWEVIISGWPPRETDTADIKEDVYGQIMMNYNHFINYVWCEYIRITNSLLKNM